uniref:Uncharacterized protein n=1 Tax=Micrurus surinamensis TaxID=129470 RepID=A0A2D4Q7K1_MICSU
MQAIQNQGRRMEDKMGKMEDKMENIQQMMMKNEERMQKIEEREDQMEKKVGEIDNRLIAVEQDKGKEMISWEIDRANFYLRFQNVEEEKGENFAETMTEVLAGVWRYQKKKRWMKMMKYSECILDML